MHTKLVINLVRGLIPSLLNEGLSGNKALNLLRSQDLHIRTKTFYNIWREYTGIPKAKDSWKRTPKKFHLPEDAFNVMDKNIRGEREYIFEALIKDPTSDDVWTTNYSFVTDDILSRDQAEQQMWSIMEQKIETEEKYQETELVDLWFDSAIRRMKPII